jgi:acetolactate synthase I/II/III large subunit
LRRFSGQLGLPVATTFHGKGVFPDDHPDALGAVGFMRHDYVHFGFDAADVIAVGYELQEFGPARISPGRDKRILHLSRLPAEVDASYDVEAGVHAGISATLDALAAAAARRRQPGTSGEKIRALLAAELARGAADDSFPLKPQRIVPGTRAALGRVGIVLADTGAVKMWMAWLYPACQPNTRRPAGQGRRSAAGVAAGQVAAGDSGVAVTRVWRGTGRRATPPASAAPAGAVPSLEQQYERS